MPSLGGRAGPAQFPLRSSALRRSGAPHTAGRFFRAARRPARALYVVSMNWGRKDVFAGRARLPGCARFYSRCPRRPRPGSAPPHPSYQPVLPAAPPRPAASRASSGSFSGEGDLALAVWPPAGLPRRPRPAFLAEMAYNLAGAAAGRATTMGAGQWVGRSMSQCNKVRPFLEPT